MFCPPGSHTPTVVPAGTESAGGASPSTRTNATVCAAGAISGKGWDACRACGPGEKENSHLSCEVCPENTYANSAHTACIPCVKQGAICNQGILTPQPGFWSSVLSTNGDPVSANGSTAVSFYQCPPDACVLNENNQPECAPGRTGPVCALCQPGRVMAGDECIVCGSAALNWLLLVVCSALLLVGNAFVVFKSTRHLVQRPAVPSRSPKRSRGAPRTAPASERMLVPFLKVWCARARTNHNTAARTFHTTPRIPCHVAHFCPFVPFCVVVVCACRVMEPDWTELRASAWVAWRLRRALGL